MSSIPDVFRVDFTPYGRDLVNQALSRTLSWYKHSPVFQQYLADLVQNGPQEIYDKILIFMIANTLYYAEGEDLDAIGRWVGQPRIPFQYDDSLWFSTDRPGLSFDQAPAWVTGAPMSGVTPATDDQMRFMILARIASNHVRFASIAELTYIVKFLTGEDVSFETVGPMEATVYVRAEASRTTIELLTNFNTTTEADDIPMVPYPATLNIRSIVFIPGNGLKMFTTDRADGYQIDAGLATVEVPLN